MIASAEQMESADVMDGDTTPEDGAGGLRVLVATPLGDGGQGGIDRLMYSLKTVLDERTDGRLRVTFLTTRGKGSILLSPLHMIRFWIVLVWLRIRRQVDVLHINLASYGSTYRKLTLAGLSRLLGVPYVLHLHGAEYRDFWESRSPLGDRLIRSMFSSASRVIVLGRVWQDYIVSRVPGIAGRTVILPNATPRPKLAHRTAGGEPRILFLGQLGERKGVPQLVEALTGLNHLPDWHATIAGDGAVEETREQVSRNGLASRIDIPGWVGPDQVERLLAGADILVLPSFAENLPVSVIEGMAAGLAVVATPVGAVEDIITHNVSGLIVPPGDTAALENALRQLIVDPDLRARLGSAAEATHRERLDMEPFCNALEEIWRAGAKGTASPRRTASGASDCSEQRMAVQKNGG